ncbi:MAG: acyltransferase family protein, partial [Clostridia bacterium]|nr:acyltransferase family protein [Clostridia bacterium]
NQANFSDSHHWLRTLYFSIYSFHMPVFIIISGRFSKKRIDTNNWIVVINKLVIPYILIQFIMTLLYRFVGYGENSFKLLSPLFSLWYIFTIAIYQFITPYLIKLKWLLPACIVVAIVCCFQKNEFFGGFQRVFTYYPFFLFGYYTAKHSFAYCKKWFFRCLAVLAFVALPVVLYCLRDTFDVQIFAIKKVYSYFHDTFGTSRIEHLIALIIRYAIGFSFFFFVMAISPSKKNLFTRLGVDSIYVYVLHALLYVTICGVNMQLNVLNCNSDIVAAAIVLITPFLCLLLTTPLVKKLTSWFIAPNVDVSKMFEKIISHNKEK